MSVTRDQDPFDNSPPPLAPDAHPLERRVRLPPMSSLLRHDSNDQLPDQFQTQSFHPPSMGNLHPLQFSEMNPSAPVHHLYQPPQNLGYASNPGNQSDPVMVPVHPSQISVEPIQYAGPSAPRRQARKISQRRADPPKKSRDQVNRSSASLDSRYVETLDVNRSPTQDAITQSAQSKAFKSSMAHGLSPQDSQTRAFPISNMLSERYGVRVSTENSMS